MKVTEIIQNSPKTVFSFELLPPLKGNNAGTIYRTIESLMEFNPGYINITTHRDETVFTEMAEGVFEKRVTRKRPGTVAIAAAIQYRYNIPVVPHILCGGFTRSETEYALIDLHFLGIENVLALRGDGLKSDSAFVPTPNGNKNANELVTQIRELSQGKYLDPGLKNNTPLDFCIGVAGYPEKHNEAPNMETDLLYLKQKVDAGAEYIVTQMFFDNRVYFDFVDKCRALGITVPIIPGIKPVHLRNQISMLPKIFKVDLPADFVKELERCRTDADAGLVGAEWAVQQAKELMDYGIPSLHIYTYGLTDNVRKIAKQVF